MAKPVRIKKDGLIVVKMGLDNSVDARNFVSQIAHLVSYDGPESKEILFQMDGRSVRQAAEWGLKKAKVKKKLRKLSYARRARKRDWFYHFFRESWKTESDQELAIYSKWMTERGGKTFWNKMRFVQTFWNFRSVGKGINHGSLPLGMQGAIHRAPETWAELVEYAGFNPEDESLTTIYRKSWSRNKVLAEIKRLKSQGHPVNSSWLENNGYVALASALRSYFGSWRAAIEAAGFDPDKEWRGKQRITKGEVIVQIIRRQVNNEELTIKAVRGQDSILYFSALDHFDGWYEALSVAGVDWSSFRRQNWSREIIVKSLKRIKRKAGRINPKYLKNHYINLYNALFKYFESWNEAARSAGFDPRKERHHEVWSPDRVLSELRDIKAKGEPLNVVYLGKKYPRVVASASYYFGSHRNALKKAGFDPDEERIGRSWSKENIIAELGSIKSREEPINPNYLVKNYDNLYQALRKHFGSWEKGVRAAGFDPEIERIPIESWSDKKAIAELKRLKQAGEPINSAYIQQNHPKLYNAIRHYFSSWEEAIREAGFNPSLEIGYKPLTREEAIKGLRSLKANGIPIYPRALSTRPESRRIHNAWKKHFPTWEDALITAGLNPEQERKKWVWDENRIILALKDMKRKGEPINPNYLKTHKDNLYDALRRYFGTWAAAVKAAGFDPQSEAKRPSILREK